MSNSTKIEATTLDKRHSRRVYLVQQLYASSFDNGIADFAGRPEYEIEYKKIKENINKIDESIRLHAPKYPLANIAKADLAILRLAVYELTIAREEPPKVIINEAVELAKELGSDRSYAFVNGALGAVLEEFNKQK